MPRKPLTEEQKIKKKISDKKYRDANKEKELERQRKYRAANKQKVSEQRKQYYNDNIEKVREQCKEWRKNNPDKVKIIDWKGKGIIANDYDLIYRIYMATNKCDFCLEPFKDSRDRCLDHNHSILDSYNIRGILCQQCNLNDKLAGYPIKIYTEICE